MPNQTKHTQGQLTVDECSDAYGYHTIRQSDGTPNGNITEQPIATVYDESNASRLAFCWNNHDELVQALQETSTELTKMRDRYITTKRELNTFHGFTEDVSAFEHVIEATSQANIARAILAKVKGGE